MKKIFLVALFIFVGFIYGCGSSTQKDITFDKFSMTVDNTFNEIDSSLVSNTQIVNNIVKSYKSKNTNGYDENMVITKTDLKRNYSIEDVISVNLDKLKTQLSGFNLQETKSLDFKCSSTDIKGSYITFTVPKTIGGKESYTISQYYFVYENKNYIISYSTQESGNISNYVKYLKTLTCK